MTELLAIRDADFDWMLGGASTRPGLSLPPGGVDSPETLATVRAIHAAAEAEGRLGVWMMVAGDQVVGLCGAVRPGGGAAEVEIGYGVAPACRRRGHAVRAVATLIAIARSQPGVSAITAVTDEDNAPSQAVLARNGFVESGREVRDDDGPVILFRLDLS